MEDDGGDEKNPDPSIKLTATCVRVPVFIGHAEAVNVTFENPISADEARQLLRQMRGVSVVDHHADEGFVTPVEVTGEDNVFVRPIPGGIRRWTTVYPSGSWRTTCARGPR